MGLIIFVGIVSFIASLIYHSKYPPTNKDHYRAQERRRKAALFIAATTVSTGYHLVKEPKKRRR